MMEKSWLKVNLMFVWSYCCWESHMNEVFFRSRTCNELTVLGRPWINLHKKETLPIKLLSCFSFFGGSIFNIAYALSASILFPSLWTMNHKNFSVQHWSNTWKCSFWVDISYIFGCPFLNATHDTLSFMTW